MAIKASGTLAMSEIAAEFGDAAPYSLSEFYRGGGKVPDVSQNNNVPTSGTISMGNFYSAVNQWTTSWTTSWGTSQTTSQSTTTSWSTAWTTAWSTGQTITEGECYAPICAITACTGWPVCWSYTDVGNCCNCYRACGGTGWGTYTQSFCDQINWNYCYSYLYNAATCVTSNQAVSGQFAYVSGATSWTAGDGWTYYRGSLRCNTSYICCWVSTAYGSTLYYAPVSYYAVYRQAWQSWSTSQSTSQTTSQTTSTGWTTSWSTSQTTSKLTP